MSQRRVFAKTARPAVTGVVPRQRLFDWLDAASASPLVWIHGPAGAGKTSLVASYVERRRRAALWYQVDAADDDPATFFAFLADAAGEDTVLPMFTAEYRDEPRAFARHFFRALAAANPGSLMLVLDNYQELRETASLHAMLIEGARTLPVDVPLVLVSREPPPGCFARARANRELRVLSWPKLRLDEAETRAIAEGAGLELDGPRLQQLHRSTQGWAAALILMIDGASTSVSEAGAGSGAAPGLMFDYLAQEVFSGLPRPTRDVLLRCACAPSLSAATAVTLTGREEAPALLRRLVEQHLLVSVKPGPQEPVYECHPLLREFLLRRAEETLDARERAGLALTAARALEEEGSLDAAAELLAGWPSWMDAFIRRHAQDMLTRGRADTLIGWIDRVPPEHRAGSPWLAYWRGCCLAETEPERALTAFSEAYHGFRGQDPGEEEGQALACARLMAALIYARHRFTALDSWIPRALSLLATGGLEPGGEARQRLLVGLFMALVFRQPHHPAIGELAGECLEACEAIRDHATRTWAQLLVAINLNYTGQFERARLYIDGLKRGQSGAPVSALSLTTLRTVESMYFMLNAQAEQCLKVADDGIRAGRETGVVVWEYHLLVNGAAGALGASDLTTADELLEQLRERAPDAGHLDRTIYHYLSSWRAMLREDCPQAFREQRQAVRFAESAGCPMYLALCRLAMAQIVMEQGEARAALRMLREVRGQIAGVKNRLLHFSLYCVLADVALRAGRRRLATASLAAGYGIAREQGFSHHPWWLPRSQARLCALAIQTGTESEFARALIHDRRLQPPRTQLRRAEWAWRYEIAALGRFRLRVHGDESRRLSGRPLQLLTTLVGLGGRDVSEEQVARTLWPRIDLEYAQRSLATALHRLRRALGHERAVLTRHGRLSLDPGLCWLDLDELLSRVRCIEESGATALDHPDRIEAQGEALFALYRGPFLEDEAEPGFSPLRERARSALLRALEVLARGLTLHDCPERIPGLYRQAQAADPLAEAFYRRHMLCLREQGQHARAVEVFSELRGMLGATAGGEPSAETRAIYDAIVRDLATHATSQQRGRMRRS